MISGMPPPSLFVCMCMRSARPLTVYSHISCRYSILNSLYTARRCQMKINIVSPKIKTSEIEPKSTHVILLETSLMNLTLFQ
jgi:hypothetical protein